MLKYNKTLVQVHSLFNHGICAGTQNRDALRGGRNGDYND
ncbi:hypothetical protein BACPEC_02973 [[Bacteroides] pectinophilus ATCC 43243]|uniref:Uncharacterized protein n=1 Tax=[Bacteroides] pectinophilus ATCC 43243 TaxID=483218 RepID=B7AW73_9FIRM|nr:hypothetical protein BACPEC_02973 [[Bacteroides] pectinophilus ATCC 43243]